MATALPDSTSNIARLGATVKQHPSSLLTEAASIHLIGPMNLKMPDVLELWI
jgi:hypothetical protein